MSPALKPVTPAADRFDHAGALPAQHDRQVAGIVRPGLAFALIGIGEIQPDRGLLQQHLARTGIAQVHFFILQHFGTAMAVDANGSGLHDQDFRFPRLAIRSANTRPPNRMCSRIRLLRQRVVATLDRFDDARVLLERGLQPRRLVKTGAMIEPHPQPRGPDLLGEEFVAGAVIDRGVKGGVVLDVGRAVQPLHRRLRRQMQFGKLRLFER